MPSDSYEENGGEVKTRIVKMSEIQKHPTKSLAAEDYIDPAYEAKVQANMDWMKADLTKAGLLGKGKRKPVRVSAKYERLNALAEIRDYLREILEKNYHDRTIPDPIREDFNLLAKHLGSVDGWCK